MNKFSSLKSLVVIVVFLLVAEFQYGQSQFLENGENANTISLSHSFHQFNLTTLKYTKSFSGKLDTYLSLSYSKQDLTDFGSPFTIEYYMPSIGLDYFLFKKASSRFSASLGANYSFLSAKSDESEGRGTGHFSILKARAFYSIPLRNFQLLPTVEYTHGFNLDSPNFNNGDVNVGLSLSMTLKNKQKVNLESKFNGIKDRNSNFELSLGFTF